MTLTDRLAKATHRLQSSSELAAPVRSVQYLAAAAKAQTLLRDLGRGHTPSAQALSALSGTVAAVADTAPADSEEQRLADSATLTLEGLAEDLEREEELSYGTLERG